MKILKILTTVVMALFVGLALAAYLGVNPVAPVAVLLVASFLIPRPDGALSVALVDLARPTGSNPGAGGGINSAIILIPKESIDLSLLPARAADGITLADIPLNSGCYMKRFYMTTETIEPSMKKIKGSNKDSGGWEISVKGFYPGLGDAVLSWIAQHGYSFEGMIIIQNCADSARYVIGEPCNWCIIDDIQSKWGTDVSKEKGSEFTFTAKQKIPMGKYAGVMKYDPTSASW